MWTGEAWFCERIDGKYGAHLCGIAAELHYQLWAAENVKIKFVHEEEIMDEMTIAKGGCKKCWKPRHEFPMAFRGDSFCSDNCRKALGLDPVPFDRGTAGR